MRGSIFRQAWLNQAQNPWMNAIALGTITCALVIFGLFVLTFLNIKEVVGEWGNRVQVTVYLADGVRPEEVERVKEEILGLPEVREVNYRSKDGALKELEERLHGQKGLLKGLPRNPLPASFTIRLKPEFQNALGVRNLVTKLPKGPEIEDFQYGTEWIERFTAFMGLFEVLSVLVGAIFLLATFFVISNTIRLNIFARREEIEIMRLVGATSFFIRAPFYLEGILQGFLGACLGLGFLYGFFQLFLIELYDSFKEVLGPFPLQFLAAEHLGAIALGGIVLGFLGTQVSVGRYLRA